MASDTVPAAVPGPGDQAGATPNGSTQPAQPGGLASLFAAVDPARGADASFDLNPTTSLDGASDSHTGGGSSAAFHDEDVKGTGTGNGSGNGSGNSANTRQERSVVRAWLLAGAERWKKGGDARLERLRISKAKANAFQVKESRTVAVNRAGGGLFGGTSNRSGGGSGASGSGKPGSGKGLGSKSGGGNSPKGPKNKPGPSGNGSAGRSGSGGGAGTGGGGSRGPSGGSGGGPRSPKNSGGTGNGKGPSKGGGANTGGTDKTSKTKDPKSPTPKNSPDSKSSAAKDGKSAPAGGGKAGPQGPAGSTGKNAPAPAPGPGGGKGNTTKDGDSKGDRKKTPGPDKVSLDKPSKTKKTDNPKTPGAKNPPKGADRAAADPRQKPGTTPTPGAGQGKTLKTQDSRETGYRDGTRAAKTVAHVKAYRDGVHDGYRDTTEAAEREKARLDQAHADRKKQRDEDKPVTGASSADYHPKPQPQAAPEQDSTQPQATPVQVTNIDATHLQLGDGAARTHISRGEVRTLRNFQNRLTAKTDVMTRVAEATKALKVHADEQAKQVTTLLEQAKAVEGGTSLVGALTKLEEHAKTQAGKAEEIHKRALRAAEASKAVVTNSETRYGDIYKAVADSPEARPAKMTYYQETANA